MAINPLASRSQLREGHAYLKRDACFLRQNGNTSATANHFGHRIVDRANLRRLAVKVVVEIVIAAKVGLIAIGKPALATRTLPKRALSALDHERSFPGNGRMATRFLVLAICYEAHKAASEHSSLDLRSLVTAERSFCKSNGLYRMESTGLLRPALYE